MALTGKKVTIVSDDKTADYSMLIKVLERLGATSKVALVDKSNIGETCCDHKNTCDCIVFDVKNPAEAVGIVKRRCEGFASVLYLKKNESNGSADDVLWQSIHRFDCTLHSPTAMKMFPRLSDVSSDVLENLFEYEVGQAVCAAGMIHKKRRADYDRLLRAFVEGYPFVSRYVTLCAVDELGIIHSCDATMSETFGCDMKGKNLLDTIENEWIDEKLPMQIGKVFTMRRADGVTMQMKLVGQYELLNGVTYYLQTWEIFSETQSLLKAVERLQAVSRQSLTLEKEAENGTLRKSA